MDNKIDICWQQALRPRRNFIEKTIEYANSNNVVVIMTDTRSIELKDGLMLNGYFLEETDNEPSVLAVACGQPQDNWLPIFVHESCHMDQYLENSPHWINNKIGQWEMWDILELWLEHHIELNDEQLKSYISGVRDLEFDCEKRSVEKIQMYNLSINVEEYVKAANAYTMFYNLMARTREWYKIGNEPYNNKAILDAMPNTFSLDFNHPSEQLLDLMFRELSGT